MSNELTIRHHGWVFRLFWSAVVTVCWLLTILVMLGVISVFHGEGAHYGVVVCVIAGVFITFGFIYVAIRRWWRQYLLGLAVWLLLLLTLDLAMLGVGYVRYQRAVDRWVQAGGIMDPRTQWRAIPAGQNAAAVYRDAWKHMPDLTDEQFNIITNPFDHDVQQLEAVLEPYRSALRQAEQATHILDFMLPIEDPYGMPVYDVMFFSWGYFRTISRLWVAEAIVAAHHGDTSRANQLILSITRLSEQLMHQDGSLIQYLIAVSIHAQAINAIKGIYDTRSDAPLELLAALQQSPRDHFARSVASDFGLTLLWVDTDDRRAISWLARVTGIRMWFEAEVLDHHTAMMPVLRQQPHERSWPLANDECCSPAARFLLLQDGSFYTPDRTTTRITSSLSMAQVAIRLRAYKVEHGQYPDTLDAIGDTPIDPVTGQPFNYERVDEGFVLHSGASCGTVDPTCAWRWSQ